MTINGYKDPSKETLESGRSVADAMRSTGLKGLKGVIVSPAGIDGRATNFNPHDKRNISINIEPDSGNSQTLTLADFTKDAVTAAVARAKTQITGNDIEAIRERSAMVFEELASVANSGVARKPVHVPPVPPPVPAKAATAPPTPDAPAPDIDRGYSPMAAFGLKRTPQSSQKSLPVTSAAAIGPPSKLLYFEKEGIGTVPAFFHDVVIDININDDTLAESGFIVLIYDLRFEQATARWFPPSDDPYKRPWAVQIHNERRLYLVHTTGFQYVYDNREFCVLLVEKAVNAE
jgi:hypothetical protein